MEVKDEIFENRKKDTEPSFRQIFIVYSIIIIVLIFVLVAFALLAAWIFTLMEPWTYGEALYATVQFISIVGFGTAEPTTSQAKVFAAFVSIVGAILWFTLLGIIIALVITWNDRWILKQMMEV